VLDGPGADLNGHLARNDRNGMLIKFNLTVAAEKLLSNRIAGQRTA
jgi:hypothetical protein